LREINKNSTGNETNQTMVERIKQIVIKEPVTIKEDNSHVKYYLLLLFLLISTGLIYYY